MAGLAGGLKRFVTEFVQWPEGHRCNQSLLFGSIEKRPGIVQYSWFHCTRNGIGAQTPQHKPNSQRVKIFLRGVYITQPGVRDSRDICGDGQCFPVLPPRGRRKHYFFQHSLILIADVGIEIIVVGIFFLSQLI